MFKILEVANVGFSRYPYFIPNFYGELSIALNLPLRSAIRESAFDCKILGMKVVVYDTTLTFLHYNYSCHSLFVFSHSHLSLVPLLHLAVTIAHPLH